LSRSLFRRLHQLLGPRLSGLERTRRAQAHRDRLGQFLPMNVMTNPVPLSLDKPLRVAVIGGGFAGLAAATVLKNLQFSVTLFEARDNMGGRVESTSTFVQNRILERGAELVGSNHTLWTFAAQHLGLGLSVITEEDEYIGERLREPIRISGHRLTPPEAKNLYDLMKRAVGELTRQAGVVTDPYNPWMTPDAAKLDKTTLESWIHGFTSDPLLRSVLEFEFSNNNAVATRAQSLLAVLTQIAGGGGNDYWEDTEVYRCENGNAALATGLAQRLTNGTPLATIHQPEIVTNINVDERKVSVVSKSGNSSRPPLTTVCDFVVIAIPPTVWSSITFGGVTFPIGPIQTGPAVKYLAETRNRYWLRQGDAPSGVDNDMGMLWEGTDNQMGASGIDLTVFAGGPSAAAIGKTPPDDYFRPRIEALLPGFKGSGGFVRSQFANWPNENFIRTGYSCPAPGQVMTLLVWMQQAIAGRIFLAGEHVSPPFFGYMEGALQSGLAAACRIAIAAHISIPASLGTLAKPGVQLRIPSPLLPTPPARSPAPPPVPVR